MTLWIVGTFGLDEEPIVDTVGTMAGQSDFNAAMRSWGHGCLSGYITIDKLPITTGIDPDKVNKTLPYNIRY